MTLAMTISLSLHTSHMSCCAAAILRRCASSSSAALSWPSGLTATVLCTLDGATPEEAVYTGTKGTLRILRPAHAPSRLHLSIAAGREP